ncbi:MAG: hypothetical protein HKM86_08715, partial [Deltaproteobacteria bacterium]|nr:hypothetical protein [Deltaproteobacteria bacterium]
SLAATAAAEKTVSVNDPAIPGVFDQPSVAVSGNTLHVAYIGADNTAGPFRLFYAAVGGATKFNDLDLTRDTEGFLITPPTPIDNTDAGNNAYVDARHPRIAIRSATEVVIFFQAKPAASPDPTYVLYLARLTLEGDAVVQQSVRLVTGLSGFNEDVSFELVKEEGRALVAYAGRSAVSGDFNVFYARISLATAAVTGTPGRPLLLSSATGSTGTRPLPSLKLDSLDRAHIAWAANDNSSSPNGIYYVLVKETDGADNVAIAATELLGRSRKWGHPNTLVSTTSSVLILAADESLPEIAGNIGMVNIDPEADDQDGSPVEVATDTRFLLTPPGEAILLESFSLYRPEAFRDSLGQIHVTGYGNNGTRSTYYAFRLVSAFPFAQFVRIPATVGLDSSEFPVSLTGDYTRAAFGFLTNGKVVVFWSGEVAGTGNRNLDVTRVSTASAIETDESGCRVVAKSRAGGAGRNADALFLVLPVAFLWMRRILRRTLGD